MRRRHGFTLVELVVVLAVALFLFLTLLPRPRHISSLRISCLSPLKQSGLGMMLFYKEHRRYPGYAYSQKLSRVNKAGVNGPSAWIDPAQRAGFGPKAEGGHGAWMLRALAEMLTVPGMNDPKIYSCAAHEAEPFEGARFINADGTSRLGLDNLSYSLTFGMARVPPKNQVVMGDRARYGPGAPLDVGPAGSVAASLRRDASPEKDEARGVNHGGDGFNLLYGDGHAKWLPAAAPAAGSGTAAVVTSPDNADPADDLFLVIENPDAGPDGSDTGLY